MTDKKQPISNKVKKAVPQRKPKSSPSQKNKKLTKTEQMAKSTGTDKNVDPKINNAGGPQPRWKSSLAREEMKKRNYDPLDELIKVAKGEALFATHPFLEIAEARLKGWKNRIERNLRISSEEIELFIKNTRDALLETWTPIEMRHKTHIELMKFAHPTLKASDINVTDVNAPQVVTNLTKKEADNFKKWFNEEF